MSMDNIEQIYELSPLQQGMLFHSLYEPGSGVYVVQLNWSLRGPLDVHAWLQAWQGVMQRHAILRTAFYWEDLDKPLQVVQREVTLPWVYLDWRESEREAQDDQLARFLEEDRLHEFVLTEAPLLRMALIQRGEREHQFVLTFHHLLLDGWSLQLLLQEWWSLYEAHTEGRHLQLRSVRRFEDYIQWLQEQDLSEAEAFWREKLRGFTQPNSLGLPAGDGTGYATVPFTLSRALTHELQAFARAHLLTLNTVVQGAWALLLQQYGGDEDLVFGVTVSGRPSELVGVEEMVGMFINTLPMRVHAPRDAVLREWLADLQKQQAEMRQYEFSPLLEVQEWSEVPRDLSLFETLLVFENFPISHSESEEVRSLEVGEGSSEEQTSYPLTLVVYPDEEMVLRLMYAKDRFSLESIERMKGHLETLFQSMVRQADRCLREITVLSEAESDLLVHEWNQTESVYPRDLPLHRLFEQQVERTPDEIALTSGGASLTYLDLNQRANLVARRLQASGVQAGDLVGLCLERSPDLIVGLIAILKAGAAYVPLDPAYPAERLSYMVQDARLELVVTNERLQERFFQACLKTVTLDEDNTVRMETLGATAETSNLDVAVSAGDVAYVCYTSGSTGHPKGVVVPQRAVARLVLGTNYVRFSAEDVFLQFAPISFDAATFEIWGSLLHGARLVLFPPITPSLEELGRVLVSEQVSTLFLTTGLFHQMVETRLEDLRGVRQLLAGGDALSTWHARQVVQNLPDTRMLNGYGPTECTTFATCYEVPRDQANHGTVPIGRPIANTQAYVLDAHLRPVPLGVTGELFLGGDGVADGYLHRPELTQEKFVAHPFRDEESARLYRTGDLARWRANGQLEFLGRADQQVKIRGYRIELGEVESVLAEHPDVESVAVKAVEYAAGDQRLVAYIVGSHATDLDNRLRSYLQARFPAFMIPSVFVPCAALPLNANGKVDKRALPSPLKRSLDSEAPQNQLEAELLGLFAEVLGMDGVGIHDSFFVMGGHSLLATRVISKVRETFSVEMPLRTLFEAPSVAQFAQRIAWEKGEELSAIPTTTIPKLPRDGDLPLSFAQKRLWFLDRLEPNQAVYSIPFALRCTGSLQAAALEQSLQEIVRRHEALRTVFAEVAGEPVQNVRAFDPVPLAMVDLNTLMIPLDQRLSEALRLARVEAERPFDLQAGPLFRYTLIRLQETDHLLVLNMHHIVSDGWSLGVLQSELQELYTAACHGREATLPELSVQYADFATWQQHQLAGEELDRQLAYWKKQLAGDLPLLQLPTDRPRPVKQTFRGARTWLFLPKELTDQLHLLGQGEQSTLFMTLLAALQTLFHRYTGQEDLTVGSPIAGRNRQEIEGLIGFFVNTLVMRTDLSGKPTFRELLSRVRETALEAYAHQEVPFEKLVEELNPQRDAGQTPLFQVMFALQNNQHAEFALPGLQVESLEIEGAQAKFDLTISALEMEDGLHVEFLYNEDLYDEATVARMAEHYRLVLVAVAQDPTQRIADVSLLTPEEREELLAVSRGEQIEFPQDKCLQDLFAEQVARTPNSVALEYDGQTMTYAELNSRAEELAVRLRALGIGADQRVGVCLPRCFNLLISLLGILKAGGVYVPLEPSSPTDRLAHMIEDSELKVLLTYGQIQTELPTTNHPVHTLELDALDPTPYTAEVQDVRAASPSDPAYIIYTSGSTGLPKGVLVEHRGLVNLAQEHARLFQVQEHSRCLQFASLQFDFSITEIFTALLSGATLVLLPKEQMLLGPAFEKRLRDLRIDVLMMTPSGLSVLSADDLPDLHTVVIGGEVPSPDLIQRWSCGRRLISIYGVTEASVFSLVAICEDAQDLNDLGATIANTQVYLLDDNLQPVPIGVTGELYIGGVGVARGYLNRPELTQAVFLDDPFTAQSGARLYKTGDLACRLSDGKLKFLGRRDHQVKVRGFRIELGEIESVLTQVPGIREAQLLVRDQQLIAYVLTQGTGAPAAEEVRAKLRAKLPEHMVPAAIVQLDVWPLTSNGKIDLRRLPAPDLESFATHVPYVAPRNQIESQLVAIWERLLDVHPLGIHDHFFQRGGHSLLAVRLVAQVREQFAVELPLAHLFTAGTVEAMADWLHQQPTSTATTSTSALPLPIAIQPQGNKPALYFIHPGGGNVFCYRELAAALGEEQPFYALQAAGIEEECAPLTDVRQMAQRYLQQIRQQQPSGPYYLGGWSMGGVVAYEMAQQLRALGEEIAWLALVDSYPLVDADVQEWTEDSLLLTFLNDLAGGAVHVESIQSLLQGREPEEALRIAFHAVQLLPEVLEFDVFQRLYQVFRANVTALAAYQPQSTPQHVVLFQAAEQQHPTAWEEYVEGELAIHSIPGNHYTILQTPHVQQLANAMRHSLQLLQKA